MLCRDLFAIFLFCFVLFVCLFVCFVCLFCLFVCLFHSWGDEGCQGVIMGWSILSSDPRLSLTCLFYFCFFYVRFTTPSYLQWSVKILSKVYFPNFTTKGLTCRLVFQCNLSQKIIYDIDCTYYRICCVPFNPSWDIHCSCVHFAPSKGYGTKLNYSRCLTYPHQLSVDSVHCFTRCTDADQH